MEIHELNIFCPDCGGSIKLIRTIKDRGRSMSDELKKCNGCEKQWLFKELSTAIHKKNPTLDRFYKLISQSGYDQNTCLIKEGQVYSQNDRVWSDDKSDVADQVREFPSEWIEVAPPNFKKRA